MINFPTEFQDTISNFSVAFRKDVWIKVEMLLLGAIICPGSRTVCNVLRSIGLRWEKNFPKYHRVLNKDKWSAKKLSGILLGLLVGAFIEKEEALVFGIDDTIERRWGRRISKRGIYQDPVRSTKSHFVKCSGLRWLSVMLLSPMPWLKKGMYWALPVLTVLCPSKRYYTDRDKSVKKLTGLARQTIGWLARCCRVFDRRVFLTGDGSFATLELFVHSQQMGVGLIARMKMNARLYHLPPGEYPKGKRGPKPPVGERLSGMEERLVHKDTVWESMEFSEWYGEKDKQMMVTSGIAIWRKSNTMLVRIKWVLLKDPEGKLKPTLLGCTDYETETREIVCFFVRRWRVEVTFAEVRRHLGVETQRQWSDLAIDRTTPSLMALFSIVCLLAKKLDDIQKIIPNRASWYKKEGVTFSDVLAAVRLEIFSNGELLTSSKKHLVQSSQHKIRALWELLTLAVA